jgi:hypothetical protein
MSPQSLFDDLPDGPNCSKTSVPESFLEDGNPISKTQTDEATDAPPRTKWNACIVCRKRKLRCDGGLPSCATCTRLNHECAYIESRRKSGPKRGYVRTLETRLGSYLTVLTFNPLITKSIIM